MRIILISHKLTPSVMSDIPSAVSFFLLDISTGRFILEMLIELSKVPLNIFQILVEAMPSMCRGLSRI